MSNTYNWNIYRIDVYNSYEGQQNVVFGLNWELSGTDGTYSASMYGINRVAPYTPGQPFIPYDDLTKDVVVGWLTGSMSGPELASYYQSVDNDIIKQQNPPPAQSSLNPPWVS